MASPKNATPGITSSLFAPPFGLARCPGTTHRDSGVRAPMTAIAPAKGTTAPPGTPRRRPSLPCAADCDHCRGSGWVFPGGDGQGPWNDKEPVRCPLCGGTGQV